MSILVKIACALLLTGSAFAESSAFTNKDLPTMASAGTVAAAGATFHTPELPQNNRTLALIAGIAAVGVTFQRVLFRGRQA